jgi:hypothetical protein
LQTGKLQYNRSVFSLKLLLSHALKSKKTNGRINIASPQKNNTNRLKKISVWQVLFVEETGVPGESYSPSVSH